MSCFVQQAECRIFMFHIQVFPVNTDANAVLTSAGMFRKHAWREACLINFTVLGREVR